jgi:putative ABC transport system permease protein
VTAVLWVVRRRLARRWLAWLGAGLLLGLGFGVSLGSFNAARRTASAYERILEAHRAPDATIAHDLPPAEADVAFGSLEGVREQDHFFGFTGTIDGVDPALTGVMLGPTGSRFPIERPRLHAGRLPRPGGREVLINKLLADRAGLTLGQRVDVRLAAPRDPATVTAAPATVVGIGTFPREVVVDETGRSGIVALNRGFVRAHAELAAYASSSLHLAPGIDARRDLATRIGARGGALIEARDQETRAVSAALRPMISILIALGVLAVIATSIAAGQVIHRDQEAWRIENETMRALGMAPSRIALSLLAAPAVLGTVAVVAALALTVATSPIAPLGPLHQLDPAQGVVIDPAVAIAGAAAIVAIIGALSGLLLLRRPVPRRVATRGSTFELVASRPIAVAGLALGAGWGRHRSRRMAGYGTAAIALTALVVTLVASTVVLSGTRSRYGFDWDVLALNPYGDQTATGLQETFGDASDVVAATGFTSSGLLVDGASVPGLAATRVKGDLGPTILEGRGVRASDEIVLGRDTLERLRVAIGDEVRVQMAGTADGGTRGRSEAMTMRVVGIAAFPSVIQIGADQPRLGIGALITGAALDRLSGTDTNDPEWTAARLTPGAEPRELIARYPRGVPDAAGLATTWYTDAKPAELRQLDEARSLLIGAIAFSVLIAVAVIGYGLWTETRANRRDLAALGAIGFTRRQLGDAAAAQAVPLAVIVTLVGVPVGIALGRFGFARFARSLAVVERAAIPGWMVAALVACALIVCGIGALGAAGVARRTRVAAVLRGE